MVITEALAEKAVLVAEVVLVVQMIMEVLEEISQAKVAPEVRAALEVPVASEETEGMLSKNRYK